MNVWIPELGKVMMTLEVPKAGEVKEKCCPAREREFKPYAFPCSVSGV